MVMNAFKLNAIVIRFKRLIEYLWENCVAQWEIQCLVRIWKGIFLEIDQYRRFSVRPLIRDKHKF